MGKVLESVGKLLGGGSSPKVDTAAVGAPVTDAANQAKLARAALYGTAGGINGATLSPDQVGSSRSTLLGN